MNIIFDEGDLSEVYPFINSSSLVEVSYYIIYTHI